MRKKQIDKALLEGCKEGDFNKVRLAINFGADVNAKGNWGRTPLHLASWHNRIETAKLLLDRGADVEAKNEFGLTPWDFAQSDGMREFLKKYMK